MRAHLVLLAAAALLGGAAPAPDALPRATAFGVTGTSTTVGAISGVRADQVAPGLTAEKLGLRAGDIVLDINGSAIADMAAFAAAAARIAGGQPVRMTVW